MRPQWVVGIGVVLVLGGLAVWLGTASDDGAPPVDGAPTATADPGDALPDDLPIGTPEPPKPKPPPAPIEPEAGDQVPRELAKLIRGDPDPGTWVEEAPAIFSAPMFGDLVDELLVDCDMEHRVVDVTCDEPPCMVAWVAAPDAPNPSSCPRWSTTFGTRQITRVAFDVDCPDGRRVRAELAPPHTALLESVEDPDAWHGGRMAHRAAAYTVADWCD